MKYYIVKTFGRSLRQAVFLLPLLLSGFLPAAQTSYFNSEAFWQRLSLQKNDAALKLMDDDTAVIIVTNRSFNDTAFRFLPDIYDGGIRYFLVYSRDGKWNIAKMNRLSDAVEALPQKERDWVVYTEGMGKLFTSGTDRAMRMRAAYNVNVIYFDYPSIKARWRRTRNYFFSKRNAAIAHRDFAPVLDTIQLLKEQRRLGNGSLNLFFHSMGNIVLQKMVQRDKVRAFNDRQWIDNLILNAACVPQKNHANWLNKIQFAKQCYVLYNPDDFTLGGAYLMSKKHQLGMKVKRPVSENATYINFGTLAGRKHSNFLNLYGYPPQPEEAIRFYGILFHGGAPDVNDTTYFRRSIYRKIGWDLMPRE